MSVKVRPYKTGWQVDVILRLPDGSKYRERRRLRLSAKTAAQRWGTDRERHVLQHGRPVTVTAAPTLAEFAPRFLAEHAKANRQKPSGIASKERILRVHILPVLGEKALDDITSADVQRLKASLEKAPQTVNNVLSVLSMALKKAVEWGLIATMPCTLRRVRVGAGAVLFHDFAEYERLVAAAADVDPRAHMLTLLGAEAGLRSGEMVALEWGDVDFERGRVAVQRSAWKGQVGSTKGGRARYVPMTSRLAGVLRTHRQAPRVYCVSQNPPIREVSTNGMRVIVRTNGTPLTEKALRNLIARAAKLAGIHSTGPHMLRHTFCSHLAMRGAPARAIQELAGHQNLTTTQRYMHLSPATVDSAIRLLEPQA